MKKFILILALLFIPPTQVTNSFIVGVNGNLTAYNHPWTSTPKLTAGLQSSGIKLIRYPAGLIGNYWDWRVGWIAQDVPQEAFTPFPWIYELQREERTYTLDDLAYYRRATGGEVVFMLNMLTRDLEDSLVMLREAQALGIPINRVELGNEFYFEAYPLAVERFPIVEDYALEANRWTSAIKAEFKDVQIAVVGNAEWADNLPEREETWNERLIPPLSPDIDALTLHFYPGPNQDPAVTYWQTLNRSDLDNYTGDIWITEWNITDHTGDIKNTELHGQLVTQWLETFAGDERVKLVLLHNITTYAEGDKWIAFWPDGRLTPAGEALASWGRRRVYLPVVGK